MGLEQRHRGLVTDLEGVAAVDPEAGPVGEDDGEPGRAREAGEPGEALGVGRDVLALVLVGPGHDEAGETLTRELGAEQGETRGDVHTGRHCTPPRC